MESFKKYVVELIGTFFLVFTVVSTGLLGVEGVIAPLAIGAVLAVMVYAGGHISGGHYNPAVSLAAAVRGAMPWTDLIPYFFAQLLGGVAAVSLFKLCTLNSVMVVFPPSFNLAGILIAEFIFTFALCWVVLNTATAKTTAGNSYYGFAIGSIVMVGAFAVGGSLCAGAFNPAVAFSITLAGLLPVKFLVATVLANLIAGICAALVFKLTYTEPQE